MDKTLIEERLTFWKSVEEKYQAAYIALIEGGVKYYMIDDRQLSRFEIADVQAMITKAEQMVNTYQAMLDGRKPRKAFGIIPRDI